MKKLVAGVAAVAVGVAFAGDITWSGAIDGDLSKPGNWGVETLSGGDAATINLNGQTFTLGSDVSFGTLTLSQTTATFDFSADPKRVISFTTTKATGDGKYFGFLPNVAGSTLSFIGGVWRGADGSKASFNAANNARDGKGSAVFSGTTVTNFNYFYWGEHSWDQTVLAKDGSVIHANTIQNYATGGRNALEVTGGSQLIASTELYSDKVGNLTSKTGYNRILIHGEGTGATVGQVNLGNVHWNNEIVVSNGASFTSSAMVLGTGENLFRATNAVIRLSGTTKVSGVSNRIEIVDSELTVNGSFVMSEGSFGRVSFRECPGTISLGSDSLGCSPAGSDNRYCFGRGTLVSSKGVLFDTDGTELNLYGEGATGGVFSCEFKTAIGQNNNNCILRISDGLRYQNLTQTFYVGGKDLGGSGVDNTIYVGSDATMDLVRLRFCNYGNRVVVDDGTLRVVDGVSFAYYLNPSYAACSNTVVFAGAHPKLVTTKAHTLTTDGWLEFNVPNSGYVSAPYAVENGLTVSDGSRVIVKADVAAIAEAHGGDSAMIPLVSANPLTVSSGVLDAMTAAFGQKGARFVARDNTLYLRTASTQGLVILLR